jgi:hypothetical protein
MTRLGASPFTNVVGGRAGPQGVPARPGRDCRDRLAGTWRSGAGHRARRPASPDHAACVRCPVAPGLHRRAGSVIGWRGRVRQPRSPVPGGSLRHSTNMSSETEHQQEVRRPHSPAGAPARTGAGRRHSPSIQGQGRAQEIATEMLAAGAGVGGSGDVGVHGETLEPRGPATATSTLIQRRQQGLALALPELSARRFTALPASQQLPASASSQVCLGRTRHLPFCGRPSEWIRAFRP